MNTFTAVYVRVSTEDQRHDSQLQALKAYCRQRGWKDLAFYQEKESGAKASRPQLDLMMSDLRSGRIKRVVAFKLDRLGRSLTHLALMLEEMTRLGVPVILPSQGIDSSTDNAAGRLQLNVLAAVAEFERALIRERVNAGLAAAKARGVRLGRPNTLDRHAAEIRALKGKGMGIRAIARQLEMPPSSVASVLSNGSNRAKSRRRVVRSFALEKRMRSKNSPATRSPPILSDRRR